jgi:hypothetical protein
MTAVGAFGSTACAPSGAPNDATVVDIRGEAMAHIVHTRRHRVSPFGRHFLEMFGVMAGGMVVAAGIFLTIVGMTWDEATVEHPLASLLVIAAGMTIPMAVWMLSRGMGGRNASEMAAARAVPAVPFVGLLWFGVTENPLCGAYCVLALAAMVGLMLYRRDEYSMVN